MGKADGLLVAECNGGQQPAGINARDGKLWFPTQGGVAVIDPNQIQTNPFAPPIVIESAMIDGETVKLNDEIELAPGKNNLEITYTGLSLIKPEFVKFRYKLEGQDAEWVEAGTLRTAYYSYLLPGEYVFTVIAANSDGVWNTTGKTLKIKVIPPFYRTWGF
ncbi:MAG TPA: triple tyrosine motif-containing protein [Pyrinomonadaceae bacterium]|nr:triple tyrosine motif-containing protein [Pyrinomonadaceae bacterium]